MKNTTQEYEEVIAECRELYSLKMKDYGTAWRILRLPSMTDQIFIKANRIRSIEMNGEQRINEGVRGEFIGIINYSIMALIQLELMNDARLELPHAEALELYDRNVKKSFTLMSDKNHDYGEAWRDMRISSFTDIILQKLFRVKQIEDNKGKLLASEGLDANYMDILNYAVFAMIQLNSNN